MSVSLVLKRRLKKDCSVTVLLSPCVEDLGKYFFCDLCVNKVCLSMRVSLCPDFYLSYNACMMTSSAGVEFPKESAPDDDGLVFEWWGVFMNLP